MTIKAIGFDFDDTIALTNSVKQSVLADVLKTYNVEKETVAKFWQELAAIHVKDDIFYLIKKAVPNISNKTARRVEKKYFDRSIKVLQTKLPFVSGFEKVLSALISLRDQKRARGEKFILFISSGATDAALESILKETGLFGHFDYVFGMKTSKVSAMDLIMQEHNIKPNEMLYVGDAETDHIASKKAGVYFFGMTPTEEKPREHFINEKVIIMNNFGNFIKRLSLIDPVLHKDAKQAMAAKKQTSRKSKRILR